MTRKPTLTAVLYAYVLCSLSFGCGNGQTAEPQARPGVITITAAKSTGDLERPPAVFPHDLHTEATGGQNGDCTICHMITEDGKLSHLFMRLEEPAGQTLEELYHDGCIDCHVETESAGSITGPVTCGGCHRQSPLYASSRRPFGFDKSLHYRHIKAFDEKCETCHHIYDEASQELVYVEGREDPCRDCHGAETLENRISFGLAAHESCIGCHREISLARPDDSVGPLTCGGCHGIQRQKAIEAVERPPRLERGQPDFVLLSAPAAELESSKLNTVPFSHIEHESATNTCRVCHHQTLAKCTECHTLPGSERGEGVTLRQAMHDMTSNHSCVGCHNEKKSDLECAGCHDLMEQGRLSEHSCSICHAGPAPDELAGARSRYESMDAFRPPPSRIALTVPIGEVPDTVTINTLADRYAPVEMPHRKIVATLLGNIRNSRIASYFHGHEDVVCEGCHHHGSVGRQPALCENCHGQPFRESALFRPGLKGAYHRQCLGCHVSMGLQTVSNCTVCHGNNLTEGTRALPTGEGAY